MSPNRGGTYNNTSNAGPFALNLNNNRANTNANIGFRSALPPVRCCELMGLLPVRGEKGARPRTLREQGEKYLAAYAFSTGPAGKSVKRSGFEVGSGKTSPCLRANV